MVCAECMKMCGLGGKNSVVKGLRSIKQFLLFVDLNLALFHHAGHADLVPGSG